MNIDLPLKTEKKFMRLLLVILFTVSFLFSAFSQQTDTIVPMKQNPEKLLRKIRVGKIEDGFNFWQDNFSGHWAGIDFGFNSFLKPNYKGYDSEFMENDVLRSNSTYVNLIQQSIGLQHNRNTVGLVTGLGLHFESYRLDKNTTIEKLESGRIEPQFLFFDQNQKSKLSILSLTIPLLAEVQIPINHYENRLYLSGGFYSSIRLNSHTKIKYRVDRKEKLKVPGHYSIHELRYGLMAKAGYRWFNVFVTYDLIPLFKENKGPELTPFTFGITLLQF